MKRGCLKGSSLDSFSLYTPLKEIMFLHIRGKGKGSILARCTLICCNLVGYSDIGISDVTGFDLQLCPAERDIPNIRYTIVPYRSKKLRVVVLERLVGS